LTMRLPAAVPVPCLRIRNAAGQTVALIPKDYFVNSQIEPAGSHVVHQGSLVLKGRAFLGGDPDRISSQGE
jgi:hypothetical protein